MPPPPATQKVIINYSYILLIGLACLATQISHAITPPHKPQHNGTTQQAHQAAAADQQTGVDDILKDTFQLLDSLDQRLAVVSNQTNSKLRSLEPASKKPAQNQPSGWRDDAELTSLAEGFSSERHQLVPGDLLGAAATNPQVVVVRDLPPTQDTRSGRQLASSDEQSQPVLGARAATGNQGGRFDNDFTERHIRFSLDLMRAVFAQHSYTAKSNTLDSFLISPVSLQLVLMMMHLGARGATKRELSHALHLLDSSPVVPAISHHLHQHHQHHHHLRQQNHLANEVGKPSGTTSTNSTLPHSQAAANLNNNSGNSSSGGGGGKYAKLTRRHQQQQQQNVSSSASNSSASSRQSQAHQANQNNNNNVNAAAASSQQQSHQSQQREQLNNVHEQFGSALRQLLKDSTVAKALTSANQIFLQRDLPLAPHYEWAVKHYYGADLRQVDFQNQHDSSGIAPLPAGPKNGNATAAAANSTQHQLAQQQPKQSSGGGVQQMINEWVERQTRGKISNFLASPVPTSTLLMALNVLFFKGDWQYKFDPQDTDADAWFTQTSLRTVKLPMMVNKLPLAHAHDPAMKTSIIELPYKAQRLGLFILLPDEIDGIFETMQALNSSSFANLISMMRKSDNSPGGGVNVRIPKFSIESSPRMSQILSQQLGLKTLFTPDQADLSGMFAGVHKQTTSGNSTTGDNHHASPSSSAPSPQVGLDELLHKAVLQVHEQGSVAAAASATIVERVGLFNGQYFEADHPFLLFLMDKQTGLVLFSGVFAGPPGSGGQEATPSSSSAAAASDQQPARANSTAQVTPGSGSGNNNSANPSTNRAPKQQPTASGSS